ncbi:family 74 glycoside hydrolase [Stachybotrys elegans]|uniref:Family 74 glycoside hydrolase n=1 Tax=Stachybotrys elegans TaxID=80388 RepID=A0A8K0WUX2_9HYPO|nr:family 74 glycoside hydrolase [Stachybotrys elegans]
MKSLLSLLLAAAPAWAAFEWDNVRLGGGGGFVPGIVFHPKENGLAYARTDIGGIYKLNADDSWTPITDTLASSANWGRWGVDALAIDPQNTDLVYAAVGTYTNSWDPNNGAIIRSPDRGASWTVTNLPYKVGGNMPGRGMGERLAVDPKNSNIIYFGARSGNGLWKSTDAGKTFSKVTSFTNVGTFVADPSDTTGYNSDIQGLAFVTFDSTSATTGGATSRIFVGTADNITASIYISEDAGSTWAAIPDQPRRFLPHKGVLSPEENALYVTYSDGSGPYDGTLGAVYRYNIDDGSWTNITPVSGSDLISGFGGLSVDLKNPGTLIVATLNQWWPDGQIFRSTDSGATWSRLWQWGNYPEMIKYYSMDVSKAPWIQTGFLDIDSKWLGWMIESLEIDPTDSDHWLYGTGLTVFGGHDLTNWDTVHNISIHSLADGIEETAVQDLQSAPGGSELFVAVGDVSGYTFRSASDLDTAPDVPWNNPMFSSSLSSDYAGNVPANVVRIGNGNGSPQLALSTDGGVGWALSSTVGSVYSGGKVAYSAAGDAIVWSTGNSGVVRSLNQGAFSSVASLPTGSIVVSDKRNNSYFYAASGANFYVSTNSGSSFTRTGPQGVFTAIRDIAVHPTRAGEVYLSALEGIFRSTDFGVGWTQLPGLTNTFQIALGVGSGSSWNLYAAGNGSAGLRLYGTANLGNTWTDIQGSVQTFGAIDAVRLAGSGNVAGLVYVGTNGRGVFKAQGSLPGGTPTTTSRTSLPSTRTTSTSTSSARITTSATRTTVTTVTTVTTRTTSRTSSAPSATSTGTAGHWQQCGGLNWTGPTRCDPGLTCTKQNDWYWQCL